jgi:hypothetical protein
MKTILIALGMIAVAASAQADILCTTHNGCRETGITLRNNGGAYDGLTHCPRPPANFDGRSGPWRPQNCRQLRTVYH